MTPDLTVIVVTWEGAHLLAPCLDALERQTLARERYHVLLVDNASTDGTVDLVRGRWPRTQLLALEQNTGFAGGCAAALEHVTTPWVALVNNDAVCAPDALEQLLLAAERWPGARLGGLTARVLLADRFTAVPPGTPGAVVLADGRAAVPAADGDLDVVNSTGVEVRTDGRGRDRGWLSVDAGDAPAEVFGFCGAAALLRTDAVREAGGFDPAYFLYYEDTDLSWRMRLCGWELGHAPASVVRHAHAQSTGEGSALHLFHDDRNRLLTLAKNAPVRLTLLVALRYLVTVASIARREAPHWRTTRVRVRALLSAARLLPGVLRQRRRMTGHLRVARRDVARRLVPADDGGSALRR